MTSDILQQYKILVEFLGKALGPDYEVVLQDLTSKNNAIIAIANGHISGRTTGSPLTNAALQMLSSKIYEKSNYLCNYKGVKEDGHILRSSTMFIKDESGTPIGLLCINFDDSRYSELSKTLHSIIHPSTFGADSPEFNKTVSVSQEDALEQYASMTENFPMDIPSLMQKIFEDSTAGLETPADRLNQNERKEVMTKLNEQGLFQLKGAISFVSKKFSCSTATIYRYLSEITN
ncbi:MAG: transcriptional regulator [Dorea sp.]